LYAQNGPAAPPPLESRVGKTITVVEPNKPQERAVIMQVWRLPDGRPAMQAHSLTTGEPLTIVEDDKAATASERFRIFRWKADGTAPEGCPKPPEKPVVLETAKPQPVQQVAAQQPAPVMPQQVPSTLTARQQGMASAYVYNQQPAPSAYVRGTQTAPVMQAEGRMLPNGTTSAYVRTSMQDPPKPIEPGASLPKPGTPSTPPAAGPIGNQAVMRTPDGRQIIAVTEPGQPPRQCVILGHVTQPDGTRGTRVQALDNGEIMFLVGCCLENNCCPTCTPCAPAKPSLPKLFSKPKVEPCPPVVVQQPELPKPVVIQKAEPPKVEIKPEPPKVVEKKQEPVKAPVVVETPKAPPVAVVPAKAEEPLQVPVPLVPLATTDPSPNVPPPQPPMKPYHTQHSPAWKAYEADKMPEMPTGYQGGAAPAVTYGEPMVMPSKAGDRASCTTWGTGPFVPVTQLPISTGIDIVYNDVQAEAAKRTVFLLTVLRTSSHPENRIWAADRLKCVNDCNIKPYVVDALQNTAKTDPAPLVRIAAMASLTDLGAHTPATVNVLEQALQDKDPRVRDCAETCLKQMGFEPVKKDKADQVRTVSDVRPQ
jgi:hypothetical protein